MNHVVFVYGTLTDPDRVGAVLDDRGSSDDHSVRNDLDAPNDHDAPNDRGWSLGPNVTLVGFERVDGRYPTLAPGDSVDGRLLVVDDRQLAVLDAYEGVDRGLYVRVAVDLEHDLVVGNHPTQENDTAESDHPIEADHPFKEEHASEADRAWVYVGDPDRLGAPDRWPPGDSFASRVDAALADRDVRITERA